jgi:uncharacterized protein (DUF608 family)
MNRPAKGFRPRQAFFALRVREAGREPIGRLLEGPPSRLCEGPEGNTEPQAGLPRFREAWFEAAYPLGQVVLSDPSLPVRVRLQAFNPLVPGDAFFSGLPLVVVRYAVTNERDGDLEVSVCASLTNFVDCARIRHCSDSLLEGLVMGAGAAARAESPSSGTVSLVAFRAGTVSRRTAWADLPWGEPLRDFWRDLVDDGHLDERHGGLVDNPTGSLAIALEAGPRETVAVTFLLAWHFPNRHAWDRTYPPEGGKRELPEPERIGNFYATRFRDAWDVACFAAPRLDELERLTVAFVRTIADTELPPAIKDAALSNLATLRSTTCFRGEDGRFYGWEGSMSDGGCCFGNSLHVWNYEHATSALFPELAARMRETELRHAVDERGLVSTRIMLPLARASHFGVASADGQAASLMRLYRDWQLGGEPGLLDAVWEGARRALEFFWVPGGWDADQDGVAEGCQLTSYDVELFGPNPLVQFWYLGALRAMERMGRKLGDGALADRCAALFERGSAWTDRNLFNGEYFEQHVRPSEANAVADGLRLGWRSSVADSSAPDRQLGRGCLTDQLAGQVLAHLCGLGYLADPEHVRRAAASVLRYNRFADFFEHVNPMRVYAFGDDAGLVNATWPHGGRPERALFYADEVWPGAEYTAALAMLLEGLTAEGVDCIADIRRRHDGSSRNPFNEPECGNHYVRSLSSWGAIDAYSGWRYSAVEREVVIEQRHKLAGVFPWVVGPSFGTWRRRERRGASYLQLRVTEGSLAIERVSVTGLGRVQLECPLMIERGEEHEFIVLPGAA